MTTMNEAQFANQIRHYLSQSARVEPAVAERLRAARARALAAYRPAQEEMPALAGVRGAWADGFGPLALKVMLAIALVAGSAIALYNWENSQRLAEIEELDAELLADDVPLDALLDRGFDNWLKKRNTR